MIRFDFGKRLSGVHGDFDLCVCGEIAQGERLGIFGPSGSGKSTILRILSGLEQPDWGEIWVNEIAWNTEGRALAPSERNLGFVFQSYALFPHLDVRGNIAFGKGVCKADVENLLEMMQLQSIAHHKISTLSGGQAQRVALARALARKPKILLLDEPFSALDSRLKHHLIDELNSLQTQLGFTLILVSHQISELYALCDSILEIDQGRILSIRKPQESFAKGHITLRLEVLRVQNLGLNARVDALLGDEIFSFSAHPREVEELRAGDHITIALKSFSPFILK